MADAGGGADGGCEATGLRWRRRAGDGRIWPTSDGSLQSLPCGCAGGGGGSRARSGPGRARDGLVSRDEDARWRRPGAALWWRRPSAAARGGGVGGQSPARGPPVRPHLAQLRPPTPPGRRRWRLPCGLVGKQRWLFYRAPADPGGGSCGPVSGRHSWRRRGAGGCTTPPARRAPRGGCPAGRCLPPSTTSFEASPPVPVVSSRELLCPLRSAPASAVFGVLSLGRGEIPARWLLALSTATPEGAATSLEALA